MTLVGYFDPNRAVKCSSLQTLKDLHFGFSLHDPTAHGCYLTAGLQIFFLLLCHNLTLISEFRLKPRISNNFPPFNSRWMLKDRYQIAQYSLKKPQA
jgi:hypothetical protein